MSDVSVNEAIARCKAEIEELQTAIAAKSEDVDEGSFTEFSTSVPHIRPSFQAVRTLKGHFGKVYAMHWSEDSEKIVSASQDGKLIIWNAMQGTKVDLIPLRSSWVMTCAYSPGDVGKFVACGGLDNVCSVYKLNLQPGMGVTKAQAELQQHEGYLSCCRFVSDEEIITSSGDTSCILWDVENQREKMSFHGHDGDVMSVSVSPTTSPFQFVSGSCDMLSKLWDWRTGSRCVKTFKGHESDINCVQYFPDGKAFGTASDDSSCGLFDLRSYKQLNTYKNATTPNAVTSIAFSSSGRMMWAGYDDHILHVWDTVHHDEKNPSNAVLLDDIQSAHTTRVSCLGMAKSGHAICSGSWDSYLKIWAVNPRPK